MNREKLFLRTVRTQAGLSREELAERTGISARMIGEYERSPEALGSASFATVVKLATALEVSTDNIFLGDTSENQKSGGE